MENRHAQEKCPAETGHQNEPGEGIDGNITRCGTESNVSLENRIIAQLHAGGLRKVACGCGSCELILELYELLLDAERKLGSRA